MKGLVALLVAGFRVAVSAPLALNRLALVPLESPGDLVHG
jgi:hypothetical protein